MAGTADEVRERSGHRRTAVKGPTLRGPAGPPATAVPALYRDRAPSRRLRLREARYRYVLLLADILAGVVALELALSVLGEDRLTLAALAALPLLVLLSKVHGLYDRDDLLVRKTTIEEVPRIFQQATLATLVLLVLDHRLGVGQIGDEQAVVLWCLLVLLPVGARMLARRIASRLGPPERVLVLGSTPAARSLRERAEERLHVKFVAAIALEQLSTGDDVFEIVDRFDVDRVIIAPSSSASAQLVPELVRASKAAGVRVSVLPDVLHVVGSQVEFDDVFGVTLLGVRRFGLTRSSRALKRSFDIVAVLATSVVTVPLLGICALLIRIDSPGPVFFRQERVGLRGRRFRMFKLRTMVDGADDLKPALWHRNEVADGKMFKIAEDPRVTRIGRWLRRTHLDELPQVINVLRGEMSLVGPRPLILDEDDRITGLDRRRLELTPGITGQWQILGTRRRVPMAEMLKLDYVYAANWSLWNDMKILLRTAAAVASRRGL